MSEKNEEQKIIIASKNFAKVQAVQTTFPFADILSIDAKSNVASKPVDNDIVIGAVNRVRGCLNTYANKYIAIEGGYVKLRDKYYIVDVCCIYENSKIKLGNSFLFEISSNMFKCVERGVSLNRVITEILNQEDPNKIYKQTNGITGYLSNGIIKRCAGSLDAIKSAVNAPICNAPEDYEIKSKSLCSFKNERFLTLDIACKRVLEKLPPLKNEEQDFSSEKVIAFGEE